MHAERGHVPEWCAWRTEASVPPGSEGKPSDLATGLSTGQGAEYAWWAESEVS
jgi:hypothetical protein